MAKRQRKYGEAWKDVGIDKDQFDTVFEKLINSPVKPTLPQETTVSPDTIVRQETVFQETTVPHKTTVVRDNSYPLPETIVLPRTTDVQQARVLPFEVVDTEYTATPNDLWDEVMPTLHAYDQVVLWQLYRLTRGHHRDTCIVGYERLAKRCNISKSQVIRSADRLKTIGLIDQLGSDISNPDRKLRGNIYRVNLPEGRIVQKATVSRKTTVVSGTTMKETTQKENTHTKAPASPSPAGVGVGSKFSLEQCQKYAASLVGKGITNPMGYATTIFRSGEADSLIEVFLNPKAETDISQCPDCEGRGFAYVDRSDHDRGVRLCRHERLKTS